MKVCTGRTEPDSVVLIFEKRNKKITEFGPCGLRDDLRRRGTDRPVAIAESPAKQGEGFIVFLASEDKQDLRPVREFGVFQKFADRGIAISGARDRNVTNPLTDQKQQCGLRRMKFLEEAPFLLFEKIRVGLPLPVVNIHENRRSLRVLQ